MSSICTFINYILSLNVSLPFLTSLQEILLNCTLHLNVLCYRYLKARPLSNSGRLLTVDDVDELQVLTEKSRRQKQKLPDFTNKAMGIVARPRDQLSKLINLISYNNPLHIFCSTRQLTTFILTRTYMSLTRWIIYLIGVLRSDFTCLVSFGMLDRWPCFHPQGRYALPIRCYLSTS